MGDKSLSEEARAKKAAAVKYLQFTVPTVEKWFASYGLLDAVFKHTGSLMAGSSMPISTVP